MLKPYLLSLSTTNKCNLNCVYCSTDAGKELDNELSLDEKKSIIIQAKDMGINNINLCGSGEPMLDDDFFELIDFIKKNKLQPFVVTNGTCINKDNSKFLYDNKVFLLFKLNSLNPVISDKLLGKKNTYYWTDYNGFHIPKNLKLLFDLGYHKIRNRYALRIESIISRYNYKDIPEIAKLCKRYKLGYYLETLIWTGRAKKDYDNLELTKNQYSWLYNELKKIMGPSFAITQKFIGCHVASNPIIGVTGEIEICHARRCNIGNIRNDSLLNLYKKAQKIRKIQKISFLKGFEEPFKTCAGRQYFIRELENERKRI